jgi:hypothetical protein
MSSRVFRPHELPTIDEPTPRYYEVQYNSSFQGSSIDKIREYNNRDISAKRITLGGSIGRNQVGRDAVCSMALAYRQLQPLRHTAGDVGGLEA